MAGANATIRDVTVVVDEGRARADGVDEDGGNGELYPHLYGAIRPDWVIDVRPAGFDSEGTFHSSALSPPPFTRA
ncbi:hypothetical protein ASF88_14570 [Leifsonia sp. Leaf336]|uniref:hypothetical protein n=1 Tax=Leifsonia sp. Leaf336 TaxID=1736341 RepID=UPI0006F3B884|nr:hypothetical protein [Leifsonia sp. Leaf336]KQR52713.1 hypothetical protein ASF88_14570 [Leifsonia sp. Leaf336]